MATRVTFANYPNGLQPIPAALDTAFDDALKLTIIPCTATGTNTIALTPIASVYPPTLTAYANYMQFSFVPVNTTTGSATVNVNGIGAKNLYLNDGTTRVGSGDLVAGYFYTISYSSSLNSSVGGFYVSGPTQSTGTWTPVLTFATPGNLSVGYSIQSGSWFKSGKRLDYTVSILTSAFTHTTASGNLQITGLQHTPANITSDTWRGAVQFGGITKANYTNYALAATAASTTLLLAAGGSGQALSLVSASDTPSGGQVRLQGSLTFWTD